MHKWNEGKRENEANVFFAMKCYLKDKPVFSALSLLITSIIIWSWVIIIFERPFPGDLFEHPRECAWLVVISITTVGYGDIVPQTYFGRGVITIACIFGSFLLSVFVVTLTEQVEMSKKELKAYNNTVVKCKVRPKMKK